MILSRKIKQKITLFVPLLSSAGRSIVNDLYCAKQRVKRQSGMLALLITYSAGPFATFIKKNYG